jgi:hypothetical protein
MLPVYQEYNVHIFRKNNLVYIATPKCGSTYYVSLILANGWRRIFLSDINWNRDHVIAFIRDVKERYVQGLVQDLYQTQSIEGVVPESFKEVLEKTQSFLLNHKRDFLITGFHSLPFTVMLTDLCDKIDWIPICPNFDHHKLFLEICIRHNCPILVTEDENIDPHYSSEEKKNLTKELAKFVDESCLLFRLFYSGDQSIYNRAKSKYNI